MSPHRQHLGRRKSAAALPQPGEEENSARSSSFNSGSASTTTSSPACSVVSPRTVTSWGSRTTKLTQMSPTGSASSSMVRPSAVTRLRLGTGGRLPVRRAAGYPAPTAPVARSASASATPGPRRAPGCPAPATEKTTTTTTIPYSRSACGTFAAQQVTRQQDRHRALEAGEQHERLLVAAQPDRQQAQPDQQRPDHEAPGAAQAPARASTHPVGQHAQVDGQPEHDERDDLGRGWPARSGTVRSPV